MSLTLSDLRKIGRCKRVECETRHQMRVTLSDLVEVLTNEHGAEVRQWFGPIALHPKGRPDLGDDLPAGRYLVVPIPGGTTDE